MDCREAQTAISALHDGETVDDALVAECRAHATACPECAAFAGGLAALDAIPAPRAPGGLTERIIAAIDSGTLPEEVEASFMAGASLPASEPFAIPEWLTRTRLWTATAAVTVCAAAVVFAVVVARQQTMQNAAELAVRGGLEQPRDDVAPYSTSSENAERSLAPGDAALKQAAPALVAFQGRVYKSVGARDVSPSDLTTAGVMTTALDGTGPPASLTAFFVRTDPRTLAAVLPDGRYELFSAVVRVSGSTTYQLETGDPIARYGDWPTLPLAITPPSNPDGSPQMHSAGVDALGVTIYAPTGEGTERGFAVAPGTPPSDPAAANPNWTWWSPIQ